MPEYSCGGLTVLPNLVTCSGCDECEVVSSVVGISPEIISDVDYIKLNAESSEYGFH